MAQQTNLMNFITSDSQKLKNNAGIEKIKKNTNATTGPLVLLSTHHRECPNKLDYAIDNFV